MHAGPVASYSAVARGTSGGVASALAGTFDRGGPQVLAAVDGARCSVRRSLEGLLRCSLSTAR